MKSHKSVSLLCLLLFSVDIIEAGIFKGGRRNDLAMLLAGGILTILFQEGAGLVRQNMEPSMEGAYMGHGLHIPMAAHAPYPGFGHPMAGFPFPMPGPGYGGMMGGYHMPLNGMRHMNHRVPDLGHHVPDLGHHVPDLGHRVPGLGHRMPYGGFPIPMGHGYPIMMHGLNLPMGHGVNMGHQMRGPHASKNGNHGSSYRTSPEDDEDFRQIFKKLENQGAEPQNGHQEARFDDSTLGVQYDDAVQHRLVE